MASNRYLEFSSEWRDRKTSPNPAHFIAEYSESGQPNQFSARSPISDASPILWWNNSFAETSATGIIGGLTVSSTGPPGLNGPLVFQLNGTGPRQVTDFYAGAMLGNTSTSAGAVYRRICSYEPINPSTAIVTLENCLPDTVVGNSNFFIGNPTPIPTNTQNSVIDFYIPGGSNIDNYYLNYYINNINNNPESILITAYDGTTRLASLQYPTTVDWVANPNINFCIRKALPVQLGNIPDPYPGITAVSGRYIQLSPTGASPNSQSYVGSYLRLTAPLPSTGATGYTQLTGANTPLGLSVITAPYGQENRITNYVAGAGTFAKAQASTDSIFTLSPGASTVNGYYNNSFLTVAGGNTRLVTSYTGATLSGSISGTWGSSFAAGAGWVTNTVTLETPFTVNPSTGANTYEIEQFSRDGWNPFTYSGSLVSTQEMVCYEVELLNLVLPNITLASGRGGRPISYPYLYLELQNISSSSAGNRGIIYSNNPYSNKMTFRVIVDDTSATTSSPFIKLDSDGMIHSIKFKPTDSFRFAVYLPDGSLFQTVQQDTVPPTPPNPLVQISACFAFKRVAN